MKNKTSIDAISIGKIDLEKLIEYGKTIPSNRSDEILEDPIWLLQSKDYIITDHELFREKLKKEIFNSLSDDEKEDYGYSTWEDVEFDGEEPANIDEYTDCVEIIWRLIGIFLNRKDAESYAETIKHHFQYGYRVYSESLHDSPQLKALLRALTNNKTGGKK